MKQTKNKIHGNYKKNSPRLTATVSQSGVLYTAKGLNLSQLISIAEGLNKKLELLKLESSFGLKTLTQEQ